MMMMMMLSEMLEVTNESNVNNILFSAVIILLQYADIVTVVRVQYGLLVFCFHIYDTVGNKIIYMMYTWLCLVNWNPGDATIITYIICWCHLFYTVLERCEIMFLYYAPPLSVAYIWPKSRTERPARKTKIGTEIAHVTRDSDTTFKVKGHQAALLAVALTHQAAAAMSVGTYWAWETTATLRCARRR